MRVQLFFVISFLSISLVSNAQFNMQNLENQVQKAEQDVNKTGIQNSNVNKIENEINQAEQKINSTVPASNTPATTTPTNTAPAASNNSGEVSISALSPTDIVAGLKEALTNGSTKASQTLNQVDGFYKNPKVKIPFPEDAQRAATELRKLGMGNKVDEFEKTLNRAAEDAAKEAAPIFKSAITSMSITDAKNILTGPDTAATGYLRKTSYNTLFGTFRPHIKTALEKTTATNKWTEIATLYNKLPTTKQKVNTDLVSYTTGKALKGLFSKVAEEEAKIRKDPVARTTDILKKVFGAK